jgi:hypothetical protein
MLKFWQPQHPSDARLLLAAEGELSRRPAARLQAHLRQCAACRERAQRLGAGVLEISRAYARELDHTLPDSTAARALLRAQLADEHTPVTSPATHHGWTYAAAGLAVAAGILAFVLYNPSQPVLANGGTLPNPLLTPGAIAPVSVEQICAAHNSTTTQPVPAALQRQVFREYGMSHARAADYEVDYLITPGLGGANDIRNLWPEPRFKAAWNAAAKDQLEDYLYHAVCNGNIPLAAAQSDIAFNWIAAYREYFHTGQPQLSSRRMSPQPGEPAFPPGTIVMTDWTLLHAAMDPLDAR